MLITNPHNPTGKCLTQSDIEKISEILDRKAPHAWVISDDVYDFLTFDGRSHIPFASYGNNWERTVTLYSAGKLMNCTGWKIGWVVGPPAPVKQAALIHEAAVFNLNVPGQVAVGWSLD